MKFLIFISMIFMFFSCVSVSDFEAEQIKARKQNERIIKLEDQLNNTNESLISRFNSINDDFIKEKESIASNQKNLNDLDTQLKASNIIFSKYQQDITSQFESVTGRFEQLKDRLEKDVDRFTKLLAKIELLDEILEINKSQLTRWMKAEKKMTEEKLHHISLTLETFSKEAEEMATKSITELEVEEK